MTQEQESRMAIDDFPGGSVAAHDEVTSSKASRAKSSLNEYLGTIHRDRWELLRRLFTWPTSVAMLPLQRRKARLCASSPPIRLHLGCGVLYKRGWINIDTLLHPMTMRASVKDRMYLMWDLRRGIPFPDNSVEAIFSEHLLEHLDYGAGLVLLKECSRVLQPGGVVRIGVPDLERYVHSYNGSDPIIDVYRPGRPTRAIALNEIFYLYGHRALYDYETLALACREAGFSSVEHSAFAQGRLGAEADSETRREESLYVEATK
jgi:predicted SAM-dependent methyltransferase